MNPPYVCSQCGWTGDWPSAISRHKNDHARPEDPKISDGTPAQETVEALLPLPDPEKAVGSQKKGTQCGYIQSTYRAQLPWAWKCVVRGGIGVLRFPLRIEFVHCPQCHNEIQRPAGARTSPKRPAAATDQEWALLHVIQANPGIEWPAAVQRSGLPEAIALECLNELQTKNLVSRLPDLSGQGHLRLGPGPALGSVLEG